MKLTSFFNNYELLVDKAEKSFRKMEKEHGSCIRCGLHCSDCCNAVFGLFLIEAAYIRDQFDNIGDEQKEQAISRAEIADRDIESLQAKLRTFEGDPQMQAYTMSRERIRCPLLDDREECILYHRRPITCRVYGIPTKFHGKAHVCGKAGFIKGETYPVFDLDRVHRELYILSKDLLDEADVEDEDKASLLISMSMVLQTPLEDLIKKDFKSPISG